MWVVFFFFFSGVQKLFLPLSIRRKQRTRSCVVLFRRKNINIKLRYEVRFQSGSEGECITLEVTLQVNLEATLQVNLSIQILIMQRIMLWEAQWANNSTMESESALTQHERKPLLFFFGFRFYLTFWCIGIFLSHYSE